MTTIENFNDLKPALKRVFGINWLAKNEHTEGRAKRTWTPEDRVLLVKVAFAGVHTYDIADMFNRTAMSIQLNLGRIAIALENGATLYKAGTRVKHK